MFYGLLLSIPIVLTALLTFAIFLRSVRENLALWCAAAPAIAVAMWLGFEYLIASDHYGFADVVKSRAVWDRTALVFVCAAVASAIFYFWEWCLGRTKTLAQP